jgi:phage repressor protein C with HTH and peptisase S24 domain
MIQSRVKSTEIASKFYRIYFHMDFRHKIDIILDLLQIKLWKLATISGLGNTLEKAYSENREMRDSTTIKFLQKLYIKKQWWEEPGGQPWTVSDVFEVDNVIERVESDADKDTKVVSFQSKDSIPFYDAVAVGGLSVYQAEMAPVIQPSETVNPGAWFRSATAAIRHYGDSMYPKYKSGSIIALKEIRDKDEIVFGEDYVVETSEQRILKRLMRSEKGEDFIELTSVNPQTDNRGKPIYGAKDFHLNKIKRVYKVLGQINYESGGDAVISQNHQ